MASTVRDIIKYNPYHDERGRFSSGPGASVGMGVGGAVAGGTRTQLESTLQEVEAKNKGLDHEVATIVNPKTGKTIFSKEGGAAGVSFNSSEVREIRDQVLTHNHPDSVIFSPSDVAMAYNLHTIRATTPDGKVYELSKVNNRNFVMDYRDKYMAARAESFQKLGIPENTFDRDLKGEQRTGSFSHISETCGKWLSENSGKYGYEYREIEKGC